MQARLDSIIRFFLYALILWLPYSPAAIEICVIGASICWLVKRSLILKTSDKGFLGIKESFSPVKNPLNIWIGLFLWIAFLACLGSLQRADSLSNLFTKTFEWFAVYFLILEVFTEKKHFKIAGIIFCITSAVVFADGLTQYYVTQKDFLRGHIITIGGRVTSSFETSNGLGAYLTVFIPCIFGLILAVGNDRRLRFCFLAFSVWILILTSSRAAWLGVVIGVIFYLYHSQNIFTQKKVLAGLVILAVLGLLASQSQWNKAFSPERNTSVSWRSRIWQDSLVMIKERPFFGHGINTYMKTLPYYQEGKFKQNPSYAHNCFLQLAVETGLLGLTSFMIIIGLIFRRILMTIQYLRSNDVLYANIMLGLLSGCLGFLIQSFFDTNWYSLQLSVYMWFLIGILFSIHNMFYHSRKYAIK